MHPVHKRHVCSEELALRVLSSLSFGQCENTEEGDTSAKKIFLNKTLVSKTLDTDSLPEQK